MWKTLPVSVPVDGASVWVRTFWWASPWQAVWSVAAATFTHSSGLVLPWYVCARWRNL